MAKHNLLHPFEASTGWKAHIPAVLVFCGIAAILVGRSLFEGGKLVCAEDAPDTWIHMWAYWRAKYAVWGNDHSYLLSHTLTYPGIAREPIAIFDPLLPLLSLPFQFLFNDCAIAFNWLVFSGLTFTGVAGYTLGFVFSRRRSIALISGVIIVANPFTYRLLAGGYSEYAWWGLLPLTVALYHKSLQRPSRVTVAGYIVSLITMLLMSIYCALYFMIFAAASLLLNILHAVRRSTDLRLKRLLKVQLLALLCLTPLLLFWIHALAMLEWKNVEWPRPFPVESVSHYADRDVSSMGDAHNLPPLVDEDHDPEVETRNWIAWRTLAGSLDIAELTSVKRSWSLKYPPHPQELSEPRSYTANAAMAYLDESAFAREWLFVIPLVVLVLLPRRTRKTGLYYTFLGLAFLLLSMGPFIICNGRILSFVKLPYAWMYHWIPGFSRFFIPARAFLGTIFCLTILVAHGGQAISLGVAKRFGNTAATGLNILIAGLILAGFAVSGYQGLSLPQTATTAPSIYRDIHDEEGVFALLDLPTQGDLPHRMYYQSVHGRPLYGGKIAEEWTREEGSQTVQDNALVVAMERPLATHAGIEALHEATDALSQYGFRYLILHREGYFQEVRYTAATTLADALFGSPTFTNDTLTVYRLPPAKPDNVESSREKGLRRQTAQ